MTPEQRYLLDLAGCVHLPQVLTADELGAAQAAADRYISMAPDDWPEGFGADLERRDLTAYRHGFAFDPALEVLTRHPGTWPILMELTDYRPRFTSGTLGLNHHRHIFHSLHAGWTPSKRPDTRRLYVDDGKIRCTDFILFVYLTDVFPGDGGLLVLPGSHKANFAMPEGMFYAQGTQEAHDVPLGVVNLPARAGDVLVISERVIHGVLNWNPQDRDRRFLILRYSVQNQIGSYMDPFPEAVKQRLSPETLELTSLAPYSTIKQIVQDRCGDEVAHLVR
jgi:hypothetical protein